MWDDGCGGGFDYGYGGGFDMCYDPYFVEPCYGPIIEPCYVGPAIGFGVPVGGYIYNEPRVVQREVVHTTYPQQQPQVVVVNNKSKKNKGAAPEEVEYMMVDPTDKEGKRLIKVDPSKVKGSGSGGNAQYVIDDKYKVTESKTSTNEQQSPNIVYQQAPQQQQPIRGKSKKKSNCCCC